MTSLPSFPAAFALLATLFGIIWASGLSWVWLGIVWKGGGFPLPAAPREPIRWRFAVLAICLGWLALGPVSRLIRLLRELAGAVVDKPVPKLDAWLVAANSVLSAGIAVIILLALWWQSPRRSLADYGIRFDRLGRQAALGTYGALLSALPMVTVALLMIPFRSQENQHALLQLLRDKPNASVVLSVALAAVVVAPVLEELTFRVVLQGWLVTWMPERAAIVLTALVFAAIHGWPDAVPLIPLALILGVMYQRTHRWFVVVLLHALFNAVNLSFALVSIHALGGAR